MKKHIAKSYNKIFNSLKGSNLSKYNSVRKIHHSITKQLKSEFVDLYGFKFYLGKSDDGLYSTGISYKKNYFDLLEKEIKILISACQGRDTEQLITKLRDIVKSSQCYLKILEPICELECIQILWRKHSRYFYFSS